MILNDKLSKTKYFHRIRTKLNAISVFPWWLIMEKVKYLESEKIAFKV